MNIKLNLSVIKTLCTQRKITLKEFCRQIGVTDTGLSHAIKNNKTTSDFLERAANFFGVSVDVFFGGSTVTRDLLEKAITILLDMDYKKDLVNTCNFIENLMMSVTIDDREEIYSLVSKRFDKVNSYPIFAVLGKLTEGDVVNLLQLIRDDNDNKAVLKLAIYRIVYNRSGIDGFADFWQKWQTAKENGGTK